jgi:membrane-associated PAP2 superfamily phosphatase
MNTGTGLYAVGAGFWRRHALWPLLLFLLAFAAVEGLGLDRFIAEGLYFNRLTGRWLGSGTGDWWAHGLLHDDGRWLVRGIAAAALAIWLLSFLLLPVRRWRGPAGFMALAMVTSVAIVGALKAVTNVDCPWDLVGFGGHQPYVPLFAGRADYLPRAQCFPGAHASSGFALVSGYFAWREAAPAWARAWLVAGLLLGCVFAIGQEARGAHFLSHDLAAAGIVWMVQLGWYAAWMRRRSRAVQQGRGTARIDLRAAGQDGGAAALAAD